MAKTNKINSTPVQATIFDVARMCNVSRGTVDRVIHNRGRVSQDTVDKVKRAIEILGYSPNLKSEQTDFFIKITTKLSFFLEI